MADKIPGRVKGGCLAAVLVLGFVLLAYFAVWLMMSRQAVSHFGEAETRSKVSRVRNDMRSFATAIEAYFTDQQAYPPTAAVLTTPVPYMTSLFVDPFAQGPDTPIAYHGTDRGWILYSAGPTKQYQIIPQQDYNDRVPTDRNPALVHKTYDPTNGTISAGDIWRAASSNR